MTPKEAKDINEIPIDDLMHKNILNEDKEQEINKLHKNNKYFYILGLVIPLIIASQYGAEFKESQKIQDQVMYRGAYDLKENSINRASGEYNDSIGQAILQNKIMKASGNLKYIKNDNTEFEKFLEKSRTNGNLIENSKANNQEFKKIVEKSLLLWETPEEKSKIIAEYRDLLKTAENVKKPNKLLEKQIEEFRTLIGTDESINIIEEYRKKLISEDFLWLVETQDIETLWNNYFKDKHGEKISDTLKILTGLI